MSNLTVVILTKNEEANIVDVIENAKQVTPYVLIVDSGSTDETVKLAQEHAARIAYRAWDNDFSAQRNFALEHVETDWVLYLDADERLNDELCSAVLKVIKCDHDRQYAIKRKSVAFGQEFNYGVLKPDYVLRLFKAKHVSWLNRVHERPECQDKQEVLQGYIRHYTYVSWQQYLHKIEQYTTIWAENAYANGKRVGIASAFGHAFFGFFQMAILKRGILDGGLGLALSCNHFFYTLMKYLKLLELQKGDGNESSDS